MNLTYLQCLRLLSQQIEGMIPHFRLGQVHLLAHPDLCHNQFFHLAQYRPGIN